MPRPYRIAEGGQTDASGNATIRKKIQQSHWWAGYATCQAPGSGTWAFGSDALGLMFNTGGTVVLGPVFVEPGAEAIVQVVGASPNMPVSIVFWGFVGEASDGSDLPGLLPSLETAGSVVAGAGAAGGGLLSVTPNTAVNLIYGTTASDLSVSPGPTAYGVQIELQAKVLAPATVTVVGRITGTNYGSHTFLPTDPVGASFSVTVGVNDLGAPNGVGIQNPQLASINVNTLCRFPVFVGNTPSQPLYTSLLSTNPSPAQAPTNYVSFNFGNPGNGLNAVIIPAVAGKRIYLFGMGWIWASTSPTLSGEFQGSSGNNLRRDSAVGTSPYWHDFSGAPLPVGAAFQFNQVAGPAAGSVFCLGGVSYSLGNA
jgi:hypothetical protein